MTISDHVARYVAIKQRLGYEFTTNAEILASFARFAEARDEDFLRADTALQWAATAPSRDRCVKKLHIVHALATGCMPKTPATRSRDVMPLAPCLGADRRRIHYRSRTSRRSFGGARHSARGTITPLTWHHMFGLIAATGIRISEALELVPGDIFGRPRADTKFRKSRMVALHPTHPGARSSAISSRGAGRAHRSGTSVLATGRPPSRRADEDFSASLRSKQDCGTAQWRADRLRIRCAMPLPFAPLRTLLATPTPAVTCWRSPPISATARSRTPTGIWRQLPCCCAALPRPPRTHRQEHPD